VPPPRCAIHLNTRFRHGSSEPPGAHLRLPCRCVAAWLPLNRRNPQLAMRLLPSPERGRERETEEGGDWPQPPPNRKVFRRIGRSSAKPPTCEHSFLSEARPRLARDGR
jgi:hypothetical protein